MFENNNQMNSNFGGFPAGTGYQFNPGQGMQPVKQMNNLTPEEIQQLVKKENQFSLQMTQTEKLRAVCNHRRQDGSGDALVEDPTTGLCRCEICGYDFKPLDAHTTTKEALMGAVTDILDILQTSKLMYIDMPPEAAREYFQIIPLIEKIPLLFEFALKNYSKHEQQNPYAYNNHNMGAMQLFSMLSGALNGGGGMGAYMQQPQQPMMQPGYGAPINNPAFAGYGYNAPMTNGFGYPGAGAVPQGYAPVTNNYQFVPNQQQQVAPVANVQAGQTAPVDATATTNGAETTVQNTFKA